MHYPQKTVKIPRGLLASLMAAHERWDAAADQLEDFLLGKDEVFLRKMKGARREHLYGQLKSLDALKQRMKF